MLPDSPLVRSWNLFHGNSCPSGRRSYLRDMVELVVADDPDVVCLQEVPVWALAPLPRWSRYEAYTAVTRRGARPASAAGWITRRHQGLLRSAITGQANAILVRPGPAVEALGRSTISRGSGEARVAHAVRIEGLGLVTNVHASQSPVAALSEVERALAFANALARPGETIVLAGDFNTRCAFPGFSDPGPGIDHILVRGRAATPLVTWPTARRMHNGLVLSDHAPVELRVG